MSALLLPFKIHAFLNAFLADFADVARLYYLMQVISPEFFGGLNSASFVVFVTSSVAAVKLLGVVFAFGMDRLKHPERVARLACAFTAGVWTAMALLKTRHPAAASGFVLAEVGVTMWTCSLDAVRVRSSSVSEAEALQRAQITALWAGTALALLLGGFAGEVSGNDPFQVFAAAATCAWLTAVTVPGLPPPEHLENAAPNSPELSPLGAALEIIRAVWPWFVLNLATQCVPGVSDAVVYFLARARGFSAAGIGALGALACLLSALAASCASPHNSLRWSLVACAAAIGLTTLASTSAEAERVPAFLRAGSACVQAAAQVALSVPFYSAVATELSRRKERRSAVSALVQAAANITNFLGTALTVGLCREFRISGDTLRGVEPLFHVGATLTPLVMLAVPHIPEP